MTITEGLIRKETRKDASKNDVSAIIHLKNDDLSVFSLFSPFFPRERRIKIMIKVRGQDVGRRILSVGVIPSLRKYRWPTHALLLIVQECKNIVTMSRS